MKHPKRHHFWKIEIVSVLIFLTLLVGCKDNDEGSKSEYDPQKPLVCDEFFPATGGVSTKLIIKGSNFGSDPSIVKVYVNDKEARVINVVDSRIYAIVPTRAGTGKIRVEVGEDTQMKAHTFSSDFDYIFRENVSTICGQTDNSGKGKVEDGTLEEAWLSDPIWLSTDNDGDIYVLEWEKGLRIISPSRNSVTTPFRVSGGVKTIKSSAFSLSQDTLYFTNDGWSAPVTGIATVTRSNGFMNVKDLAKSETVNALAVNPVDGEVFINNYKTGEILRYDKQSGQLISVFTLTPNREVRMCFSQDGKFLYLSYLWNHTIGRLTYDLPMKMFTSSENFIGAVDQAGNQEGTGTGARINTPRGLVCDEDGNLLFCDTQNNCIRKVTPAGVMTTYAGTPGSAGYLDDVPSKAKFRGPEGIAIDKSGTIYIADTQNHRIRKIVVE